MLFKLRIDLKQTVHTLGANCCARCLKVGTEFKLCKFAHISVMATMDTNEYKQTDNLNNNIINALIAFNDTARTNIDPKSQCPMFI